MGPGVAGISVTQNCGAADKCFGDFKCYDEISSMGSFINIRNFCSSRGWEVSGLSTRQLIDGTFLPGPDLADEPVKDPLQVSFIRDTSVIIVKGSRS